MNRDTMLIFEDNCIECELLTEIFQQDYNILTAANGKEGLELLSRNFPSIAVVLLDHLMPVMDGFQVLEHLQPQKMLRKIPFIMVTGQDSVEFEKKGYEYGVVSYIKKPYQPEVIKQIVSNAIGWFQYKTQLETVVKKQNENIKKQNDVLRKQNDMLRQQTEEQGQLTELLVSSLSNIMEFRNLESRQHSKRIQEYTICLGRCVMNLYPEYQLTEEQLVQIGWASYLHDIGKIAIPDSIILKSSTLTPDEFELVKSHTTKGAEIIARAIQLNDKAVFDYACDIARHHHEKYDGLGYPDGLKGDEISIAAQIVSLVDVYDALTSKRVYKAAYKPERAHQMIVNGNSGTFSPKLLTAFAEASPEFERLLNLYRDED